MASILQQFPLPQPGFMTELENGGQMTEVLESLYLPQLIGYPEIVLQNELSSRTAAHYENAQLAFLSCEQTSWKKLLSAWQIGGLLSLLEAVSESKEEVPNWLLVTCRSVLSLATATKTFISSFCSHSTMSEETLLSKFTHVNDWHKSPIQALAWHPHVSKVALALHDDSVHIYYPGNTLRPILKHKLQKKVVVLAWQPLSASVLAVACQTCVLIWHVEPTSLAVRPSASTVQVLDCRSQVPVTSLSWSPDGSHLISASPKHTSIIVWDVPMEKGVALKRGTGGGVSFLQYSPDGSKLFTATPSQIFRVWETKYWQWENWSHLSGPCTAASWSPDGSVLIFAMEGDSALYAVRFQKGADGSRVSASSTAVRLADVSQVSFTARDGSTIKIGGEVKSLVWDSTGERLAVMFKADGTTTSQYVAVFKSTVHPVMELLPGGFVKGKADEMAHHIAFLSTFSKGALLSVVWSSGRVGYIPMFFIPAKKIHHQISAVRSFSSGPFL